MKIISIKKVGKKPVHDITVKDAEHYILKNGVVTHNTALMYAASEVFIITKSKERDGESKELTGYNFTMKVEKSRIIREESKLPISVTTKDGILRNSGLIEIGLDAGVITKPKQGWYKVAGIEKNFRYDDLMKQDDIFDTIIKTNEFCDHVKKKYCLSTK